MIQARSASTRLPSKIYKKIGEKSVLERCYSRCEKAAEDTKKRHGIETTVVVIGTSSDWRLVNFTNDTKLNAMFLDVDEDDCMERLFKAAALTKADIIVRVTADCWIVPPTLIMKAIQSVDEGLDYISNTIFRTYPEGFDVQAISKPALAWFYLQEDFNREHPFVDFDHNATVRNRFIGEGFRYGTIENAHNPALIKTSIDTEEDLKAAREYFKDTEALSEFDRQIKNSTCSEDDWDKL